MENIKLTIPAYDPEGRRIPDGAVHYWNGTTPASVENEKLKIQVKSFEQYRAEVAVKKLADKMLIDNLIMQLAEAKAAPVPMDNDIVAKLEKIEEDINFVKGKYTKPIRKPSNSAQAKEERKQAIRMKMETRGKKS